MLKRIPLLLVVLLSFPGLLVADDPCPRNQPVIAYHSHQNVIFLFGGFCSISKARLNDLWKFDGKNWTQISSEKTPEARSGHTMIYDSTNNWLVVFGGKNNEGELLNDLWAWDGETWKLLAENGPVPRQSHRLVFHSTTGQYFLFGGSNAESQSLNDSWVYGNGSWKQIETDSSPPARRQHTLAFDIERNTVVLFGGFDRVDGNKTVYGDTWEWDEDEGWQLVNTNTELARDHHTMAYDAESKKVILFGGYNNGYFGDTRSWDGKQWLLESESGPSGRAGKPGLVYSSSEQALILFGGGNGDNMYLMDFWKYSANVNQWNQQTK